ncbi:MAG: fused MFS/spermidine synthase [Acidobacteriia bacterium]|nr:fused MFS/spermidine synthase [Terriglobia bacterium]
MPVYAATIFLSAFLLFQVQPLIAKFILPWFGGSAAVWSAALLFFQLVLLAGYFYAHLLIRYLKPKQQLVLHATLLAVSLATLPIVPASHWKPTGGDDPTLRIILLLGATVGLPYMLLSATSPLLQAWYVRTHAGAIPYRLFALSNLGSMLALLSYPVLVEPKMALGTQAVTWSVAYGGFALLCALAGYRSREGVDAIQAAQESPEKSPGLATMFLWIGLAACASTLLLAVTSHLTQNVAPIPLLWIAPLSLYLLSFILCFESDRIYNRYVFLPLLIGSLALLAWGDYKYQNNGEVKRLIPALCAALFVCCMVCHGELARRRPHPQYLTQFYLMVSVGGAVGGLFVALAAPRVFTTYFELPVAMIACPILVLCALWTQARAPLRIAAALGVGAFAAYLIYAEVSENRKYVLSARNFYGVLRVRDDAAEGSVPAKRVLIHGTINHGTELRIPGADRIPTSYFGKGSGISLVLGALHSSGPIHMGILGLGAGVTAALAQDGDTLHYYEINPLVVEIANRDFSFFRACPAEKQLYMGDGRLVLEKMPGENLDFLAMDAFSSDAVPVHLLTKEAYATYARHLKPTGVLAINISNRYLDLAPVVAQAAADLGWSGVIVFDDGEEEEYYYGSTWVLISRDPKIFHHETFQAADMEQLKPRQGFRAWTDDYSNIIQILK